jgi:hypothetical protein
VGNVFEQVQKIDRTIYPQLLQKRNLIVGAVCFFILGSGIVEGCSYNSSEWLLNDELDSDGFVSDETESKYDRVKS